MLFGTAFRVMRKRSGFGSQVAVAAALGVKREYINTVESGRRAPPSPERLREFLTILIGPSPTAWPPWERLAEWDRGIRWLRRATKNNPTLRMYLSLLDALGEAYAHGLLEREDLREIEAGVRGRMYGQEAARE